MESCPVTACGAIFVELGERPEFDRLRRCTVDFEDCINHDVQLDWVRGDPDRLAAYNQQLRRYDLGQRIGVEAEQESLL
jgi:hypothetical protein